uniref:EOG090X09CU n=1 Tax=Alona affinis TaxID=381656 RepID=A0A9N6ZEW2_9CRUS|nr:EOG090X09CU [Alona affinis]
MLVSRVVLVISLVLLNFSVSCLALNKYSKEANQPAKETVQQEQQDAWKDLDKPFRLAKINLIWAKAQKRLTEFKLKSLYSELKVQDKEELQLKRLRADNLDKDGLKEAEIRAKFGAILERYGLADHFDKDHLGSESNDVNIAYNNNNVFKDKKLNKLWLKAESAGFTETELKMLKEEFVHHQEKVLQFYSLLEEHNSRKLREDSNNNKIEFIYNNQMLTNREKEVQLVNVHRELKSGYDRLERMTLSGPKSRDFEEAKVQSLWKIALNGDFSPDEMESLRTELRHYEQRLMKLRYLQAQHSLVDENKEKKNQSQLPPEELKQRIKLQERKVEKIHADLEARITQRHFEL